MDSSLPSGLTNLENTCFANTTFQTILYIPLLQEYINKHEECSYCQHHNIIYCTFSYMYIKLHMLDKKIEESLHAGGD